MASTINYMPPLVNPDARFQSPSPQGLPASAHCNVDDLLVLGSGQVAPAAVGASANIAGFAQQDSNAVFQDTTSGSLQGVFGFSQQATGGLAPGVNGWILFLPLQPQLVVEMSLLVTVGWVSGGSAQVNVGSACGINKDATTGFYILDPAQTAVGHILQRSYGPGRGQANGDLGARVFFAFDVAGVLSPGVGH